MFQEAAAGNAVDQPLPVDLQTRKENRAHGRIELAFVGRGECREVMLAFDEPGERDHTLQIERIGIVMDISPLERLADLAPENAVLVSFRDGIVARMKSGGGFFGCQYANGLG